MVVGTRARWGSFARRHLPVVRPAERCCRAEHVERGRQRRPLEVDAKPAAERKVWHTDDGRKSPGDRRRRRGRNVDHHVRKRNVSAGWRTTPVIDVWQSPPAPFPAARSSRRCRKRRPRRPFRRCPSRRPHRNQTRHRLRRTPDLRAPARARRPTGAGALATARPTPSPRALVDPLPRHPRADETGSTNHPANNPSPSTNHAHQVSWTGKASRPRPRSSHAQCQAEPSQ